MTGNEARTSLAAVASQLLAVTQTTDELLAGGDFDGAAGVLEERGRLMAALETMCASDPSLAPDQRTLAALHDALRLGERHKERIVARLTAVTALQDEIRRAQQLRGRYQSESATDDGTMERYA